MLCVEVTRMNKVVMYFVLTKLTVWRGWQTITSFDKGTTVSNLEQGNLIHSRKVRKIFPAE